jgi:FkbM family methyltransferase
MHWSEMLGGSFEVLRRKLRGEPRFSQQIALPKLQLGSGARCYTVVPNLLRRSSIVYSFGIGEDASFDLELIGRFGCTVHAFDPSRRAQAWVRSQSMPPQFNMHPYGLSDRDGVIASAAREPTGRHSHGRPRRASQAVEFQVRRLVTLMRQLGHPHVDLLKLDAEVAESAAIEAIANSGVRPTQLLLDFQNHWREDSRARSERALAQLNAQGYRIFDCQPGGLQYSLALV